MNESFVSPSGSASVFRLFGKNGLETDRMPPVGQPIMHDIAFHCHAGKHNVLPFDWDQCFKFADMHLR